MTEQNEQHVLVLVNVTATTLDGGPFPTTGVENALVEAVRESLEHGEQRGFNHALSDTVGISVRYVGQHTPPEPTETLRSIIESAEESLTERLEEQDGDINDRIRFLDDPSEVIHEIADSAVPVYNYTLLHIAANDNEVALTEPEIGPAFDGSPTPVNIIAANIYEAITNALHEEARRLHDELVDAKAFCDACVEDFHEDDLTECAHGQDLCKECTTTVCKAGEEGHTDDKDDKDEQATGAEEVRRQSRPDDVT